MTRVFFFFVVLYQEELKGAEMLSVVSAELFCTELFCSTLFRTCTHLFGPYIMAAIRSLGIFTPLFKRVVFRFNTVLLE
jgi:hypothetical protein